MKVKELPEFERPREKALRYGVKYLSNRELLAIIIRTGCHGLSSLMVADDIIRTFKGILNLSRVDVKDLLKIRGISKVKAIEVLAAIELSRRISFEKCLDTDVISDPRALIAWLNKEIGSSLQEKFMVIYLDIKNRIITNRVLFTGTIDQSLVHPREIFKEALVHNSTKILLVHNHPSGVISPSRADIETTKRLVEIGNLMGISILDHLIVSHNDFFSFKKDNLI